MTNQPEALQYADRDHTDLGSYYMRHVSAMTGEALHSKSAIAAELAHRDREIDRLQAENANLNAGYAAARLEIESLRGRSVPVSEADMALAAMETGEWELQRLLPQTCFTSEANIRNAWSVKRSAAPYCTKDGLRIWTGATPLEALCNGAAALGVELPGCSETAALPKTVVAILGEQAELRRLSDCCPELNLSNYGHDDVDELNGWAIEVSQCIDRALAAQPAGAQQPGAAYAALPDADRDYMRKVVAVAVTMLFDGYKGDVTRVFSTDELSEFVTITAAMGWERVEDIYRRAWDLLSLPVRASHGQAPAQPAPDVSGYVSEWTSGICTADEAMDGIAKLYAAQAAPAAVAWPSDVVSIQQQAFIRGWDERGMAHQLKGTVETDERMRVLMDIYFPRTAAPTTQTAPQQEAQEPVAWYVTGCSRLLDEDEANAEARHIGGTARAIPLYTAPQHSPTPQADSALKDHQIAALVNELRDIAVEFHGTQQLRERIARVVVPALKAQAADSVLEDAARYRWLRATTNYVTSNGERIDVRNTPEKWDAAIDAARAWLEAKK